MKQNHCSLFSYKKLKGLNEIGFNQRSSFQEKEVSKTFTFDVDLTGWSIGFAGDIYLKSMDNNNCQITYTINSKLSLLLKLTNVMRKPAFDICENKGADQLRCKHVADQRLC